MLWKYKSTKNNKRLKTSNNTDEDDEDSNESSNIKLPFLFQKNSNNYINTNFNHIYFNNDITSDSVFELCKEIRNVEMKIKTLSTTLNIDKNPIYLHITTNGGCIYSAFSVIDCIKTLSVPVYTIVDGFVASAGTLISLAGKKRYMCENAYMLIHELRGGVWGKMSEIDEEYTNSKKLMDHIKKIYSENTNIKEKKLDGLLKKDLIWDIEECLEKGLIHEIYKPS
jgi:ATP-dependent protease ClpP protease subunit